jgi:hypothetical protein
MGIFDKLKNLREEAEEVSKKRAELDRDIAESRSQATVSRNEVLNREVKKDFDELASFMQTMERLGIHSELALDTGEIPTRLTMMFANDRFFAHVSSAYSQKECLYETDVNGNGVWGDWVMNNDNASYVSSYTLMLDDIAENWSSIREQISNQLQDKLQAHIERTNKENSLKAETLEDLKHKSQTYEKKKADFER